MRRVALLLLVLCLGFAPAPVPMHQPSDTSQRDLQAMQGEWAERFADSATVTVKADRMFSTSDHAWKITLHTKATPNRIEALGVGPGIAGKTRLGLYRLEKDKLTICWRRGSAGKLEWPASTRSRERVSGSDPRE